MTSRRRRDSHQRRFSVGLLVLFAGGNIVRGDDPVHSEIRLLGPSQMTSNGAATLSPPQSGHTPRSAPDNRPAVAASRPTLRPAPVVVDDGHQTVPVELIARRPWLLQKLVGPQTEPSVKMTPPRPPRPLPDPPSTSRIVPALPGAQPDADGKSTLASPGRETQTPSSQQQPMDIVVGEIAPPADVPTATSLDQAKVSQSDESQPVENDTGPDRDTTDNVKTGDFSNELVKRPVEAIEPDGELTESDHYVSDDPIAGATEPDIAVDSSDSESASESAAPDLADDQTDIAGDAEYVGDEPALDADGLSESADQSEPDSFATLPWAEQRDTTLDYAGYPLPERRMSRSVMRMQGSIARCLRYYFARPETANGRSNWGMMHAIMVYGIDTRVIVGRQHHSAIAWIAGNNACRGQTLLAEVDGEIYAKSGVGLQGHQGQFLAVLALAAVPADYGLYANDNQHSVAELIAAEMRACESGKELTFTLIGLSHYLRTDAQWQSADGQSWNFERLLREEMAQPIVGSACGGTHRLMGLAHALRARRAEGQPIDGQWKRAEKYLDDFVSYTYRLQNRDGSMSTDWFEGREDNGNIDRKIQTTGHMVEWLLTNTPDSELQNPKLVAAIRFLLRSMYEERDRDWEIGPKGHALRSLAMYYERVYQQGTAWRTQAMAASQQNRRR